ncbi:secretion/DNA translocation related TadE-like protein [Micrococcus sp. TA1]|nr:secretion/DNA translocation related TadE-like protein [Micrococcus sp. TA1]
MITGDRGAGAVTVLLTVFTTLVLLAAATALGTAGVAAARASAAADLAALAAADAARGLVAADPCALAGEVTGRHGGRLTGCSRADGGTVLVRVRYASPLPWPAEGVSRAGPPPVAWESSASPTPPAPSTSSTG